MLSDPTYDGPSSSGLLARLRFARLFRCLQSCSLFFLSSPLAAASPPVFRRRSNSTKINPAPLHPVPTYPEPDMNVNPAPFLELSITEKDDRGLKKMANSASTLLKVGRRQSCEACRLRRVKCDRFFSPHQICTECRHTGVKCRFEVPPSRKHPGDTKPSRRVVEVSRVRATRLRTHPSAETCQTLLDIYYSTLRPQLPAIDLTPFMPAWQEGGGCAESMAGPTECATLVTQLWAAVISENSSMLSATATFDVANRSTKHQATIEAMTDHARQRFDQLGLIRKTDPLSCGVLLVFELFLSWGDPTRMKGRYYLNAAVEHLRSFFRHQDHRAARDPPDTPIRQPPLVENSARDRDSVTQLFWKVWLRDATNAAISGRAMLLDEMDLDLMECFTPTDFSQKQILEKDPRGAIRALTAQLGDIFRYAVQHFLSSVARKAPLAPEILETIWTELDASVEASQNLHHAILRSQSAHTQTQNELWHHDLASLRCQLNFVLHRHLLARFSKEVYESAGVLLEEADYLDMVRNLENRAAGRLLRAIVEFVDLMNTFTGNIHISATLNSEFLSQYATHLLFQPTLEEGSRYEFWTFDHKIATLTWIIGMWKQLSRSWPNLRQDLESLETGLSGTCKAQSKYLAGLKIAEEAQKHEMEAYDGGSSPWSPTLQGMDELFCSRLRWLTE